MRFCSALMRFCSALVRFLNVSLYLMFQCVDAILHSAFWHLHLTWNILKYIHHIQRYEQQYKEP
jgi:hypothetical protein